MCAAASVTITIQGAYPTSGDRRDKERSIFGGGTLHDHRSNIAILRSWFNSSVKSYGAVDPIIHEAISKAYMVFIEELNQHGINIKEG